MPATFAAGLLCCGGAAAATFDCVIEPRQTVELFSPVEGAIDRIRVDRGDAVTKGQVLVELDSGVERAAAELARARSEMQGAVKSAEGRVEFSGRKFARRDELNKQNFVSAQDRDESAAEKLLAEAELLEATDNRRVAELEYRRTAELLRLRTLKSPFDGVVVERYLHPGAVAGSGEGKHPILKLADVDVLYVEVVLPTEVYRLLKPGMTVEVVPERPFDKAYSARLTVIDRVLDAASGSFGVRLELPNPRRDLPAGMKCKAMFSSVPAKSQTPKSSREAP